MKVRKLIIGIFLFAIYGACYSQNGELVDPFQHDLLGKEAPLFKGKMLDGKDFNLMDYRGKIVVLHFWSLKCSVCYKEILELNSISDLYKSRNVVVISLMRETENELLKAISIDSGFYKLKKKVFGNDLIQFQIIPGLSNVMKQYIDEEGSPFEFIVDEKGILRGFFFGYMVSYGNSKPMETENYKMLVGKLERLIEAAKH